MISRNDPLIVALIVAVFVEYEIIIAAGVIWLCTWLGSSKAEKTLLGRHPAITGAAYVTVVMTVLLAGLMLVERSGLGDDDEEPLKVHCGSADNSKQQQQQQPLRREPG